jgi:hypothetical protein
MTPKQQIPHPQGKPRPRYCIGFDPGVKVGVAIWDRERQRLDDVLTTDMFGAIAFVRNIYEPDRAVCYVEDPRMNRPVFEHGELARRKREKIAQNVGQNKENARLLVEGLERLGYTVERVRPTAKKWTKDDLRRYAGYTGRTSAHARDAARLVVGK